jgi:hypothetical protein
VIVEIFVAKAQPVDTLQEQLSDGMFGEPGVPQVRKAL